VAQERRFPQTAHVRSPSTDPSAVSIEQQATITRGPLRLTKAQRVRDTIPIVSVAGSVLAITIVFPIAPVSTLSKLERARNGKRRNAVINTIGGYPLHGLHYQRMCGNDKEESCDEGYFHIRCIRAFLSVL